MNNIPMIPMTIRGVERNPWNVPEDELTEWSRLFSGDLPVLFDLDNIPNDDILSTSSEETTMLIDDDASTTIGSLHMEMLIDNVQDYEISSSTSTNTTLAAINNYELKKKNLWLLQPALNSVYNIMSSIPSCHNRQTMGEYQMAIGKDYDNGVMTPLAENTCLIRSSNRCPMNIIQSKLLQLMKLAEEYPSLNPSEKESLITNFNYLANLIKTIEEGFRAQREWNMVIQCLRHGNNYLSSSNARNLETSNLPHLIKTAAHRCTGLAMDEHPPLTTLFNQFQNIVVDRSYVAENEIEASKMYLLMTDIFEMMNQI